MVTGTGSEEIPVEAMKAGLDEYVIKAPRHCKIWGRLSVSVKTVLERAQERRALRESETPLSRPAGTGPLGAGAHHVREGDEPTPLIFHQRPPRARARTGVDRPLAYA